MNVSCNFRQILNFKNEFDCVFYCIFLWNSRLEYSDSIISENILEILKLCFSNSNSRNTEHEEKKENDELKISEKAQFLVLGMFEANECQQNGFFDRFVSTDPNFKRILGERILDKNSANSVRNLL